MTAVTDVGGSLHDFRAEHPTGTRRRVLQGPRDAWGGRRPPRWTRAVHDRDATFRADAWQVAEDARLRDLPEETYACAS